MASGFEQRSLLHGNFISWLMILWFLANVQGSEGYPGTVVPCHNCQRYFASDHIGVYERFCKGPKKTPPNAVVVASD